MNYLDKVPLQIESVKKLIDFMIPCKTEQGVFKGRMKIVDDKLTAHIGTWKSAVITFDHAFSVLAGDIPYVDLRMKGINCEG